MKYQELFILYTCEECAEQVYCRYPSPGSQFTAVPSSGQSRYCKRATRKSGSDARSERRVRIWAWEEEIRFGLGSRPLAAVRSSGVQRQRLSYTSRRRDNFGKLCWNWFCWTHRTEAGPVRTTRWHMGFQLTSNYELLCRENHSCGFRCCFQRRVRLFHFLVWHS